MGFLLKKLLGAVLMPVPMVLVLAAAALWLWRRGRIRAARAVGAGAAVILWLGSTAPVATRLAAPLEWAYPAFPGDSVDAVVVLGGGHVSDARLPVSAVLNPPTLYRLVEGVRIARAQPWTEVILSGFPGADPRPNAEAYRDLAVELGVDPGRITLEARAPDTAREAEYLAPRLRGRRFALVTSATHMPRAVALFRGQGLDPVPAPTGHLSGDAPGFDWLGLVPTAEALAVTRRVWYEVLGRTWAVLLGRA